MYPLLTLIHRKMLNFRYQWPEASRGDIQDLKVQVAIAFLSVIHWNENRNVVQINLVSEFKEQGIQNSINDIEPLEPFRQMRTSCYS